MIFAICVTSKELESRINEALPQINEKWKKQLSRMGSGSWEALGRRGDGGGARQREDAPSQPWGMAEP